MSKHYRKQNNCLNCGATVHGKFCGNCGQENLDLHEPFWHFLSHSIGHYFHFDTKFYNTIVPLITKPGQLTLDYIEGKRTRYLQPVSMFIFISIVYFLLKPFIAFENDINLSIIDKVKTPSELVKEIKNFEGLSKREKQESLLEIKSAQLEYFSALKTYRQDEIIDSFILLRSKQKNKEEINKLINDLKTSKTKSLHKFIDNEDVEKPLISIKDNITLKKYGVKFFFILTPIFAFFLMINFRRNKKYYLDHIIFTLHLHSFGFIVLIIIGLLNLISFNIISLYLDIIAFLVTGWYSYTGLKLVYKRTSWVTIRKMISLYFLYGVALIIAVLLFLLLKNMMNNPL